MRLFALNNPVTVEGVFEDKISAYTKSVLEILHYYATLDPERWPLGCGHTANRRASRTILEGPEFSPLVLIIHTPNRDDGLYGYVYSDRFGIAR